jgi:hypothetical protein
VVTIALGIVMLFAAWQADGWPTATASDGRHHLLEDKLRVVITTEEIPSPVIAKFAELTKTKGVVFAQPGAKYQVTDVISEPGLPRRRLIFAALSDEFCVLTYERGGIGHSEHEVVFQLVRGGPALAWRAVLNDRPSSLKKLRDSVRKGEYIDNPDYAF